MKINLFGCTLTIAAGKKDITKTELKDIVNTYKQNHPEGNPVFAKITAITFYRNKIEQLTGNRPGLRDSKEHIEKLLYKWHLV